MKNWCKILTIDNGAEVLVKKDTISLDNATRCVKIEIGSKNGVAPMIFKTPTVRQQDEFYQNVTDKNIKDLVTGQLKIEIQKNVSNEV